MNDNNKNPDVEVQIINDMMQSLKYWKELYTATILRSKGISSDHSAMIKIKIVVAESRLLEFVPDDLLNELGF